MDEPANSASATADADTPETDAAVVSPTSNWSSVQVLALIVFVAGCWAAQELLIPIMLAMFLALVANPLVTRLVRWRVPRWIGAFFVVFGGVAIALALASQLVAPASEWMQRAPQELRQVAPKLKSLVRQVDAANKAAASIVNATGAGGTANRSAPVTNDKPAPPNLWTVIRATPRAIALVGAVFLLSYFFVVYGVALQRQAIALLPDRQKKKLTEHILQTIETELSRYVLTITTINVLLGAVLTLTLWWLGLDIQDALLWGAMGALLNYAPYVGPVIGVVMLALVGVVAFDDPSEMLLPPALYLCMQVLESEVITPIVLGRRWSISPLVVLLWLLFCGWLWGIAGVLLAVPMLVCFKIVAERVDGLNGWSKVIA